MGGLLSSYFGASAVFMFGAGLIGVWLILTFRMKPLPAVKNLMFHVRELSTQEARRLEERLSAVLGVTEAKVIAEEGVAYLKVDGRRLDEPALRALLPST
jgi:hypothetical protein